MNDNQTKITDYDLIMDGNEGAFAQLVRDRIRDGWQPYGSPFTWSVSPNSGGNFFCQAIVRYANDRSA